MVLTKDIKASIDKSILCWLATVSSDNVPNVSPKEIFTYYGTDGTDRTDRIIIANIASPQSVRNIRCNALVCISFIDILVQKGFQLKGRAKIIDATDTEFKDMESILLTMTGGLFPFSSIIDIWVETAKPILAPRYVLYPETKEEDQIESAKRAYGI